jgi:hypothetical protein
MAVRISSLFALTAAGLLMLGAAACTEAEQDRAATDASAAGESLGDAAQEAGEVVELGAMKAAQAVESGAGAVADNLEQEQAEARAEGSAGVDNTPAN